MSLLQQINDACNICRPRRCLKNKEISDVDSRIIGADCENESWRKVWKDVQTLRKLIATVY